MTASKPGLWSGLPTGLTPPVKVALARAVAKMPRGNALPGTLSFEPKWDGYRCIAVRDDRGAKLWSRQGKELTGYSVGVKRNRAGFWLGESAVSSARQVLLTCLSTARCGEAPIQNGVRLGAAGEDEQKAEERTDGFGGFGLGGLRRLWKAVESGGPCRPGRHRRISSRRLCGVNCYAGFVPALSAARRCSGLSSRAARPAAARIRASASARAGSVETDWMVSLCQRGAGWALDRGRRKSVRKVTAPAATRRAATQVFTRRPRIRLA
jgi:hypothetical protein